MSQTNTVIDMARERGEFIRDVDGFTYWQLSPNSGHLSAWMLRALADELDRINGPWERFVSKGLSKTVPVERQ